MNKIYNLSGAGRPALMPFYDYEDSVRQPNVKIQAMVSMVL